MTATEAPLPTNAAKTKQNVALGTPACPAVGSCVATGSYNDTNGHQQGLIETDVGGTWKPTEAPVPANAASNPAASVDGVACPAVGSCVAVGGYNTASGPAGLIETLSVGTWRPTEEPLPANAAGAHDVAIDTLVCPALGSCVAVGYYGTSTIFHGLIETLSAGAWTAKEAPVPANGATSPDVALNSLACSVAGSCVAVGYYGNLNPINPLKSEGLIETLSAGTWKATEAPLPANAAGETAQQAILSAVACPAAGSCVAGGDYETASGLNLPGLIETLTAGIWKATEAPLPANGHGPEASINSVVCPALGSCVAAGYYSLSINPDLLGLLETLTAGTWKATEAPLPPNAAEKDPLAALYAVICPAIGSCLAVGTYYDTNLLEHGLIETLTGTWKAMEALLPANAAANPDAKLFSLACPNGGSCLSIGFYTDKSGNQQGVIETLPGLPVPTTTVVSSSRNPSSVGDSLTLTAKVSPTPIGGSVAFSDNGSPITACRVQPISSGAATCHQSFATSGAAKHHCKVQRIYGIFIEFVSRIYSSRDSDGNALRDPCGVQSQGP